MQIDIKNVIQSIVESFLPRFSDSTLGLLILLDLSYTSYSEDGENDISIRKPVYYLIQRPSNYTKVLILDSHDEEDFRCPPSYLDVVNKKDLPWVIRSDHDSCWRSDGLHDLFNIECDIMDNHFGGYPITPDKVSVHNTIGGISNGIYYVELAPFTINREETYQNIFINKRLTVREAALLMPEKE